MSEVTRTAGVAGTFTVTFSQAPVESPTVTVYSDSPRTTVAAAPVPLLATTNPLVWTANYPPSLAAGRYYLTVQARYTVGQPLVSDSDDILVLTAPQTTVAGGLVTLEQVKTHLFDPTELERTGDRYDAELLLLIAAATPVLEDLAGPIEVNPPPARAQRAALRWITWSWRRDHGGSETYLPGGVEGAPPGLGVDGIRKELALILGSAKAEPAYSFPAANECRAGIW